MSIGTSNKRKNKFIEISSDHTKYKTLNSEDITKDTPAPLPTAITSNNYNYKKADKVDNFIMKFLQNNNNLPTLLQQKSNTTTAENERGEDPVTDIPDLHGR